MSIKITLTAKLPIQIIKKANWFVASCAALDIASQGETEEMARKNISEALNMFLRSCIERGTLDAVLKECGFNSVVEQDQGIEPLESSVDQEYVDIPLYLAAQFEEDRRCHHV
ncbi:MAG: type II toxin-antitoxin system HicB family antitoxin [Syntrophobacteraceae bacterium]